MECLQGLINKLIDKKKVVSGVESPPSPRNRMDKKIQEFLETTNQEIPKNNNSDDLKNLDKKI